MKKGTILGICLLSLFAIAAGAPIFIINASFDFNTPKVDPYVYTMSIKDINGDKIQDELISNLQAIGGFSEDIAIKFSHPIRSIDKYRLAQNGVTCSDETWDLGTRIKVTSTLANLQDVKEFSDIEQISLAKPRQIIVAILGTDFSELSKLEQYEGAEIFWEVGCALVPYYSGAENDIKRLGVYSSIVDTTDMWLYPQFSPVENTYATDTVTNAFTINATSLVSSGIDGSGVKVAIVDTGINDDHPDLIGRVTKQKSFVSIAYGYDYDDLDVTPHLPHGSHVAGIVGGDGTGNPQYKGIAPGVAFFSAKIGDWTDSTGPASTSSMVAAINWAVSQGCDVINLSYGTGRDKGFNPIETALANAVRNSGVSVATSAGNDGADGYYTCDSPEDAIAVGAVDDTLTTVEIASFSARGPNPENHMRPDIMAPGVDIWSCSLGTGYIQYDGTSMASPQIAGGLALLIDACRGDGIDDNPGTLKAALLETADLLTPISSHELLLQGRGLANIGKAWTLIKNAPKEGNVPLIGAINPVISPIKLYENMYQGQIVEHYLDCISPFKTNLSIEITGDAASFITKSTLINQSTAVQKLIYSIPFDATPGDYDGVVTFKYKTNILATADIEFTVHESKSQNRMLLNLRTTAWGNDHLYGQYDKFTADILENGWVMCEQSTYLTPEVLENYRAIWFPDPFSLLYPNYESGVYNNATYNALTVDEVTALRDYINNGGSVIFNFLGYSPDADVPEVIWGTDIKTINAFTEEYGIKARDDVWGLSDTRLAGVVNHHALTAGVTSIDQYGCTLEISGDAVQLTALTEGSPYGTLAYYQSEAGGRVVVLSTNFCLDSTGYINGYGQGITQNDQFGRNLVRWTTTEHRMKPVNVTYEKGVVNMTYAYAYGPGADFGGYVITPKNEVVDLTWTEISPGYWSSIYEVKKKGIHYFYPECGETEVDDFDYIYLNADTTKGVGNGFGVIVLISFVGLSSWYLISKKKRA
ncbi:MAG: S8 family serine peptidase [Candidatus Thorarchaeota archaeon]